MDRDTLLRFTTTGWDYVFIEESAGRAKARRQHCFGKAGAALYAARRHCGLSTVDCKLPRSP